jgi:hypothetical protein
MFASYLIDQAHVEGLLRTVEFAEKPHLTCFLLPYNACHMTAAITSIKATYTRPCLLLCQRVFDDVEVSVQHLLVIYSCSRNSRMG